MAAQPSTGQAALKRDVESYILTLQGKPATFSGTSQGIDWECFYEAVVQSVSGLHSRVDSVPQSITNSILEALDGFRKEQQSVKRPPHHRDALPVSNMTDPLSRHELDAKLEAIEARLEGRVARIEDAVKSVADSVKDIRKENQSTGDKLSALKTTIITTAVVTVVAIVLGIAAFNGTLTSNMLSAFQAGLQSQTKSAPPPSPTPPPSK